MNYISFLMDPWIASIFAFIAIIAILIWRDRENIEREGILIVRRTERGLKLIDSIAKISPRFWKVISSIGVFISVGAMILIFYLIITNVINVFLMPSAMPALSLVLPTYSTSTSLNSGLSFIPFWYWIIGLATVVVVHEMMHGIVGRAEDFPLKSVGWALFAIIPAAFVEPEGEEMLPNENDKEEKEDEAKPWTQGSWIGRLRVLAAGSFSNITFGIFIFFILANIIVPGSNLDAKGLYNYEGVEITDLNDDSPALRAGLRENMTIMKFNGASIHDLNDIRSIYSNISLNKSVEIVADDQTFRMVPQPAPEGNLTYKPAPIDYFLVFFEQQAPGTIESYEEWNNLLVPENKVERKRRWMWVKDNYPNLVEKAESRINELERNIEREETPWIGINGVKQNKKVNKAYAGFEGFLNFLTRSLFFIFLFNLGVGAANMLPIKPLDGGHIVETLSDRFIPDKTQKITKFFSYATLGLIIVGFLIYYSTWIIGFLL